MGLDGTSQPPAHLPICEQKGACAPPGVRGTSAPLGDPSQSRAACPWLMAKQQHVAPELALMCQWAVGGGVTGVLVVTAAVGAQGRTPTQTPPCKWGGTERRVVPVLVLLSTPPHQSSSVSPDAAPEDSGHFAQLGEDLHGL